MGLVRKDIKVKWTDWGQSFLLTEMYLMEDLKVLFDGGEFNHIKKYISNKLFHKVITVSLTDVITG